MIFINGCSFSETQYNKNGIWKPWSDYLIDDYSIHVEIFNNAVSSNGQGKILDTTIESIETYPKDKEKIHCAIIQFSAVARGYANNFDKFVEKITQNTNYQSLIHEQEYNLSDDKLTDLITYVDWLYYKSTLCKIIVLKNYFENKKIPYLFFWGWQQITPDMESDSSIKKLLENAYDGNWWRFGKHGGMNEWGIDKFGKDKAIIPEDFHPTTMVHEAFYKEVIKPYVNKILL